MEAEAENDPYASIMESCRPTSSQEAAFDKCLFIQVSAKFVDSSLGQSSSSPTLLATLKSSDSAMVEEDLVFLIPPEHQTLSHPNPNECCAESKVRVSEAGLDDDPEAKRARIVPGEQFEGETELVGVEAAEERTDKGKYESKTAVLIGGIGVVSENGKGSNGDEGIIEDEEGGRLLELLNGVIGDSEKKGEEEDILETAKKCGWSFPTPRWWPEDWSDELP